jgi:hypothetical protein
VAVLLHPALVQPTQMYRHRQPWQLVVAVLLQLVVAVLLHPALMEPTQVSPHHQP